MASQLKFRVDPLAKISPMLLAKHRPCRVTLSNSSIRKRGTYFVEYSGPEGKVALSTTMGTVGENKEDVFDVSTIINEKFSGHGDSRPARGYAFEILPKTTPFCHDFLVKRKSGRNSIETISPRRKLGKVSNESKGIVRAFYLVFVAIFNGLELLRSKNREKFPSKKAKTGKFAV